MDLVRLSSLQQGEGEWKQGGEVVLVEVGNWSS
jgi:hypothetical protein